MEQDKDWPDIAGRIEDRCHNLAVRVYFEDTDFSGVVYHASYLRFCERGRSDFLRLIGIHHVDLFETDEAGKAGLTFAVRHMEIDFLGAAKIDDVVVVKTSVVMMTGVRLKLEQNVLIGKKHLLKAIATIVLLDDKGRPKRFPKTLLTNLSDFLT